MKRRDVIFILFTTAAVVAWGQVTSSAKDFPELVFTHIPGAPPLSQPALVTSTDGLPLLSRGFGLAAPAFYDWDGDGAKDLLIGEFASGTEHGRVVGSFVRVYLNTGTEEMPSFTGKFDYARAPFKYKPEAHGTPYSVDQYCCIGFTPQFVDLDKDGYEDMITGSYQGEVSWFRGSKEGFHAGVALTQEGDPRGDKWVKQQPYWLYSSASFGDLTGDGNTDLIVGGRVLRLSKNIGTNTFPQFARREPLLDVKGNPLTVYTYTHEELEEIAKREYSNTPYPAGDYATSPYVVDWDNDGVLDLLVTNSYSHQGFSTVDFFRGVKKNDEHRFEEGRPLFTAKNGGKPFPGTSPFVSVTDWNNDGINDLLIGCSVVMLHDKFNSLSWMWNKEANIVTPGKGPATLKKLYSEEELRKIMEYETPPKGVSLNDFLTLEHHGYVYMLLGQQPTTIVPDKIKKRSK